MSNGSFFFAGLVIGGILMWWGCAGLGLYLWIRQARRVRAAREAMVAKGATGGSERPGAPP